ncbi:protein NLRC5 isoform X3 [Petaurus breviceps papuanus]|uniref:protein NLRC5 isoform X3 n=1 Tax=Petaurus breviceps papuanus TaxID=3040969 RepID=UPI0036DCC7E1
MDSLSLQDNVESLKNHLVGLLSEDLEWLTLKAKFFLPDLDLTPVDETPVPSQKVSLLLSKLEGHGPSTWKTFIYCVLMEHTMPLYMETMFLSVWGIDSEVPNQIKYFCEDAPPKSQLLHSGLKRPYSNISSSPRPKWSRRQQLESVRRYEKLLRTSVLQRYGRIHVRTGRPLSFSQTYVDLVMRRGKVTWLKENPEKSQGNVLSEPLEAEDGTNLKVQDLFKGQSGAGTKVTVLLGKPGAGKSMLMDRICQMWANGELDQFSKVFLFEFRQLNLVNQELTLSQLLFELYLSPEDEHEAIFQHLQENAHRVLLVFDGLDEFLFPWPSRAPCIKDSLNPTLPLPVATLFSRLCNGSLLPGCWVVTTSRPGRIPDFLLETATSVFEVWGFDWLQIEKYVSNFFYGLNFRDMALSQLRDNTQLQSLCSVPALCCIMCICLYHLLSQGNTINFPSTVTQVYMQMIHVFISRKQGASEDKGTWLSKNSQALLGLGELAFKGLEAKQIVFYPGDIPELVVAFAATHNLLASFRVKTGIQQQKTCYAFVHLSLQEFFAALYLMVSPNIDKAELGCHFFLKSKWPLRTEAKTELLDHFHTFLSGFSSQTCRSFLSQLSQKDEAWVGTKQVAIQQVLQGLAARSLTGPKMIELCHCVGETQDAELVKQAGGHLPFSLDFHNFPLNYADLAALTSLINHAPASVHLDFSGCSLEPQCLDALAGCEKIESLRVRSRKCRDAFAEALSKTLPTMGNLKKLDLQDNKLNDPSCLKIIEILHKMPRLQKIDLSRNAISVLTVLALAKEAVSYPKVTTLEIRQAQIIILFSVSSGKVLEMPRSQNVKKNEPPENVMTQTRKLTFRLQKCNLAVRHAKEIAEMLKHRPYLEEVDLSGNQLEDEGCRELAETLPDLQITKQFNISDNGLSEYGVFYLLTSANACKNVVELDISLKNKTAILRFAGNQEEKDQTQPRATASTTQLSSNSPESPSPSARVIRLRHCGFQFSDLERLCQDLGNCSHLDLSNNHLGNKGIEKLTHLLPGLRSLQFLTLHENRASLKTVFCLASTFSDLEWIHEVDISLGRQQSIHVRCTGRAREQSTSGQWAKQKTQQESLEWDDAHFPKSFCLRECQMDPPNLEKLLQILKKCQTLLEIKFSHVTMSDQSIEVLLDYLPQLHNLNLLQLSHTTLSLNSVFLLVGTISLCEQLQKVEVRSQNYACLYFTPGKRKGVSCGLIGCCISPVDMEQLCGTLAQCKDLNHLDLSGNLLGDEGLRFLLQHLPQMNLSGSLNLSHNDISQEGALLLAIALSTCRQAYEVSLGLDPEQKFLIQFSEHQESRKTLRLTRFNFQQEHITRLATLVGQVPKLTDLILANYTVSLRGLCLLLNLVRMPAGILRISVEEPWVTNASITTLLEASLHASGNITKISISRQQSLLHIEEAFPQQTENPEVATFRLVQCDLEASQTFPYGLIQCDLGVRQIFPYRLIQCDLGASPTLVIKQVVEKYIRLQELSWSQVHLCDASTQLLKALLLSLLELKKLRLTASVVSPEGVCQVASGLSHCNTVEELDLSENEFSVEDTRMLMGALEGKCQLRSLNLSSLQLDDLALSVLTQRLRGMSLLQRLDLSNSGLSSIGCSYLSDSLKDATNLEDLNLSHNKIEDAGVQHLSAILPTLLQLRKINLSWNSISPAGGRRLAEALALCVHVEELHLGANTMGDLMAIELAQNLPHHLKVLHLCSNQISTKGTLSLGQALARCQWIEEISLAENIFAEGILPLSEGLLKLKKINLTSCKINDQMTKPLASSLILCHDLEEILLAWNSLGNEGATELAHVLPQMNQLKKLDLEGNQIGSLGAHLLAKGLAKGPGIQVICLWKNPVPKDTAQFLQGQDPRLNFS